MLECFPQKTQVDSWHIYIERKEHHVTLVCLSFFSKCGHGFVAMDAVCSSWLLQTSQKRKQVSKSLVPAQLVTSRPYSMSVWVNSDRFVPTDIKTISIDKNRFLAKTKPVQPVTIPGIIIHILHLHILSFSELSESRLFLPSNRPHNPKPIQCDCIIHPYNCRNPI